MAMMIHLLSRLQEDSYNNLFGVAQRELTCVTLLSV